MKEKMKAFLVAEIESGMDEFYAQIDDVGAQLLLHPSEVYEALREEVGAEAAAGYQDWHRDGSGDEWE